VSDRYLVAGALLAATIAIFCATDASGQAASDSAAAGQALFTGRGECSKCHVGGGGPKSLGPDLSWVGLLRTPESLRRSLVDPDADVHSRFVTIVVQTRSGQTIEGLSIDENDASIRIRDRALNDHTFLKSDLTDVRREHRSLMPPYASRLTPAEIDSLVAYLRTLRTLWPVEHTERIRDVGQASENVAFFDRPERAADEKTDDLVRALEIRAGARIADVGAGTGYFTWRLAEAVGAGGKVLAVDIQRMMLDHATETVRSHELSDRVEYVLAAEDDPHLPANSLDMVFLGHAYHEFSDPDAMLTAIRRALKPNGRLVVVEYAKENSRAPASTPHKMSFDEIRSEIEPAGFDLDRILDFLPVQHGLIFTVRH
jgi:putative heme-binding domain-containing protein